jgi:energy-converting hydrogenase Eha subunit E
MWGYQMILFLLHIITRNNFLQHVLQRGVILLESIGVQLVAEDLQR